jgi:hypothetical protein
VKAIVEHCYEARDFDSLNANVSLLSKKHGQLKAAVQAIVELVMGWLEDVKKSAGTEKWLELVQTLRGVTEGKVRYALKSNYNSILISLRSFWKPLAPALRSYWLTIMKVWRVDHLIPLLIKSKCKLLANFYRTCRSKRTRQWTGEKRPSSFLNR